jgi:hypothetical protein
MEYDYLKQLPLSPEEKSKIMSLGAPNSAALLAMIQAVPDDFAAYLGQHRTRELETLLKGLISEPERSLLDLPTSRFNARGAVVDRRAPRIRPLSYDVEERDRLFEELQRLRGEPEPSSEKRRAIDELERTLNSMMEGG